MLPIDGFIKSSRGLYRAENVKVVDNIVGGGAEKLFYCTQPVTTENPNGFLFDRNTYVHKQGAVFAGLPESLPSALGNYVDGKYRLETKAYTYDQETIQALAAAGIEPNGMFWYE